MPRIEKQLLEAELEEGNEFVHLFPGLSLARDSFGGSPVPLPTKPARFDFRRPSDGSPGAAIPAKSFLALRETAPDGIRCSST
jgi:hypothetical protein